MYFMPTSHTTEYIHSHIKKKLHCIISNILTSIRFFLYSGKKEALFYQIDFIRFQEISSIECGSTKGVFGKMQLSDTQTKHWIQRDRFFPLLIATFLLPSTTLLHIPDYVRE